MKNITRTLGLALAGVGVVIGAAACGPPKYGATPQQSTQVKADANALAKCLPTQSATQQLVLAKSLTTHAGREALIAACGIPAKNKSATEAQILSAAEKGNLTSASGRYAFFYVTLPKIIEANQA